MVFVPLVVGDRATGVISLQNLDREHAFSEADVRLLVTLAASLSVALENARLFEETRQRNAELALINDIQRGLAENLDAQAMYDLVGDRIREIFDAQVVDVAIIDPVSGLVHFPYVIEAGERLDEDPIELIGLRRIAVETRAPVVVNEDLVGRSAEAGQPHVLSGEVPKSSVFVPLLVGDRATGLISLQNLDHEHAFSEADVRLLVTLAGSLSVALENARLFEETRQRSAELALINEVQRGLAEKLDMQTMYDLVGDRIQEIFDAQVVDIATLDESSGLIHFPYAIERGEHLPTEPIEVIGFRRVVIETRETIVVNEDVPGRAAEVGNPIALVGETPKSAVFVPLSVGDRATGVISLQNIDREHAFSESDVRLLTTIAGSLSVALENARLFEETRQRNAELALINDVQRGLAQNLDMQAMYDLVGERLAEIFDAQNTFIAVRDREAGLIRFPYTIERGIRLADEPIEDVAGPTHHVLETREPLLIEERFMERVAAVGGGTVQGEAPKSGVYVPLVVGDRARGVISLQSLDREHAFSESDVRLLTTIAGSLSVALENARLFEETRQRAAELALINDVQRGLAENLEMQAMYELVGDRIQELFDAQVVDIGIVDRETGLMRFPYAIERGERYPDEGGRPIIGFARLVMESREPLLVNERVEERAAEAGSRVIQGESPKSVLFVPLVVGGEATGRISLQNVDHEHAFSEGDVRLLTTLAGSLSVALENARLFEETRQRSAELALINDVQGGLAERLDTGSMYELVGERIREIFDAQVVNIATVDPATDLVHFRYAIERGELLEIAPIEIMGFRRIALETREPVIVNEDAERRSAEAGQPLVLVGEPPRSMVFVPLVVGDRAAGVISVQNLDREQAFSETDVRLLTTIARSLSVALENASLFEETRQRSAELALINDVQRGLAENLEMQAMYDLVGDRISEIFDAQVVFIAVRDQDAGLIRFPYTLERGVRLPDEPIEDASGPTHHVLETREPLLIESQWEERLVEVGGAITQGELAKSGLFVPLLVGGTATGVVSLQNLDREHAFDTADVRLLTTFAGSLGVALQNARLFEETRQRSAELALINDVQRVLAENLEMQAMYDIVGNRIGEIFDAQTVDIGVVDGENDSIWFPFTIERGVPLLDEPIEIMGFRKIALETLEPVVVNEDMERRCAEAGNPRVIAGEPSQSSVFVPLAVGNRGTGVMSLHNLDREHAFSEADVRLLVTIAGSLSVALENARLFQETGQRAGELAMVNSVGQAIADQLDLDALMDRLGDQLRDLFGADIVYVALHAEATGIIEFPYYFENGQKGTTATLRYGEGLASRILMERRPLLLNRAAAWEEVGAQAVGTPALSYLGVPITVEGRAIGAISVQSTKQAGRFGESETRLLSTIAANVGVAVANARLYRETQRRANEMAALAELGREVGGMLDLDAVLQRTADRARALLETDTSAVFLEGPDGPDLLPIVATGDWPS